MSIGTPHFELPFFTNLLILLVAAKIFGEIFERFKQPAMIGEIIAGIILGPSLLNLIHRTEEIKVISELGIFLLVIIAGLEINIEHIFKSLKGRNIIISILAFFVPILSGLGVALAFDIDMMSSVFIGLCVAITALPVSVRILMDLGKLNTEVGQKIISIAIFDDVIALSILGVLMTLKDSSMTPSAIAIAGAISLLKLLIFVALLIAVYLFFQKILKRGNYIADSLNRFIAVVKGKEPLFALFFAFILLFATITESLGLHFIVGSFFAAMLINDKLIGKEHLETIEKSTSNMAMGFLAPIFFAGIGLEFNLTAISNIGLLVAVIAVSYFSKIVGGYVGGRLAGLSSPFSFALGIGLNARGIMELVIANIAYNAGLISDEIFSILVLMGVLTTLTTPIMMKKIFNRFNL